MESSQPLFPERSWTVLVILGASGTGKSTAARELAVRQDASWLQVDDLRLALQYSRVSLPERTERLYFFERTEDVWSLPLSELVQGFIDVAELMVPAVRVVIDSHVVTNVPLVLEGDGILPALLDDPVIWPHAGARRVRFCTVTAGGAGELLESMVERGRGMDLGDADHHRRHAEANAAFGEWLAEESRRYGIPLVPSRPFTSLTDRILAAVHGPPSPEARKGVCPCESWASGDNDDQ